MANRNWKFNNNNNNKNPEDRKLIRFLYLLNVIGVHNNEDTEQSDGDEEVQVLQNSSHFGSHHLWEPLLHPYERLLWIHLSLSLSLSGRRIFPREWQKTSKLLTHFFSLLSILFPQDTFQTMRIILIRKKKVNWFLLFHSFWPKLFIPSYSTLLFCMRVGSSLTTCLVGRKRERKWERKKGFCMFGI